MRKDDSDHVTYRRLLSPVCDGIVWVVIMSLRLGLRHIQTKDTFRVDGNTGHKRS